MWPLKHASWAWKYVYQAKNEVTMKVNSEQCLMNRQFSIKNQYKKLRRERDRFSGVDTYGIDIHNPNIESLCGLLWRRLKTRQRLQQMNMCDDEACLFCQKHTKTIRHLMFECAFNEQCITRA